MENEKEKDPQENKSHYKISMELFEELGSIRKKLKKKRLDPEERNDLEQRRKAIVQELIERQRNYMATREDWRVTIANYMYHEFKKQNIEEEKAKTMAIYGIKQLYEIGEEVELQMQKEKEAKQFFEKYPELAPKKKWYTKDDNIIFLCGFFGIALPLIIILIIGLVQLFR